MITNTTAKLLRAGRSRSRQLSGSRGPAVFGRNGQGCHRCHETIESRAAGRSGRMLYWCPGCQVRLDRHRMNSVVTQRDGPAPGGGALPQRSPWRFPRRKLTTTAVRDGRESESRSTCRRSHTLLSTQPLGSSSSRKTSSVMSVVTLLAFFGQAGQIVPFGGVGQSRPLLGERLRATCRRRDHDVETRQAARSATRPRPAACRASCRTRPVRARWRAASPP